MSDFDDRDLMDDDDRPCRYCNGRGYLSVESGSSLSYPCPDCTEYEDDDDEDDDGTE
jgi:hypothetical protein